MKTLYFVFIWLSFCAIAGVAAAAITVFHPL